MATTGKGTTRSVFACRACFVPMAVHDLEFRLKLAERLRFGLTGFHGLNPSRYASGETEQGKLLQICEYK